MRRAALALLLPFAAPAFAEDTAVAPTPPPPVFLTGTATLFRIDSTAGALAERPAMAPSPAPAPSCAATGTIASMRATPPSAECLSA